MRFWPAEVDVCSMANLLTAVDVIWFTAKSPGRWRDAAAKVDRSRSGKTVGGAGVSTIARVLPLPGAVGNAGLDVPQAGSARGTVGTCATCTHRARVAGAKIGASESSRPVLSSSGWAA